MASSAKKREAAFKPLSKKTKANFRKRMQANNLVLSKLGAK
jgi:hypothetical protein